MIRQVFGKIIAAVEKQAPAVRGESRPHDVAADRLFHRLGVHQRRDATS